MKILITGATGFVGSYLVDALTKQHHQLVLLTRNSKTAKEKLKVNAEYFEWPQVVHAINDVDVIIHLAGASIMKRWTQEHMQNIYDSRIQNTQKLVNAILASPKSKPSVFISASAVGFYGDRKNELLVEDSGVGRDFLAQVCRDWEQESMTAASIGIRTVCLRFGLILGHGGGALTKMLPIFKAGLGGKLGSGSQWMSWIHIQDVVRMILFCIENEAINGAVNAVSPNPVTNIEFTQTLGTILKRPTFFTVPSLFLKLAMGKLGNALLSSQRTLPEKITQHGFSFEFSKLDEALKNLFVSNEH